MSDGRSRRGQRTRLRILSSPLRLVLIGLVLVPSSARAQIATDRPNVVESPLVVEVGTLQAEAGLGMTRTSDVDVFAAPLLVRYGIAQDWELRLETPGLATRTDPADVLDETGLGDVALGAKWHLRDADERGPGFAVLLHADLPTGTGAFQGSGVRPSVRGTGDWSLTELLTVSGLVGVRFDELDERRFTSAILAGALGQQWTSDFGTLVEVAFTQIASEEYGGNVGLLNFGGIFTARDWLQFDALLGLPLTDGAPDVLFTVGLSYRTALR
jgi:hypothetical protein